MVYSLSVEVREHELVGSMVMMKMPPAVVTHQVNDYRDVTSAWLYVGHNRIQRSRLQANRISARCTINYVSC